MMNTTLARTTNNSLENLRPQELLEQQANEFYIRALSRYMQQNDSIQNLTYPFQYLDTTETESLRSIAQTQVRIGGRAVYLAESILFEYYHPIGGEIAERKEGNEENLIESCLIYPNPTDGLIFIQTHNFKKGKIIVNNLLGVELFRNNFNSETNYLDLKNLSSGNYFVRVENSDGKIISTQLINLSK